MHPPYVDIVKYSDGKIADDLSNMHDIEKFVDEIEKVAKELYRVLKPGKFCAILMGDTRRNKMYQPLAFNTGFWVNKSKEANFLLIIHEHLFIFQKLQP